MENPIILHTKRGQRLEFATVDAALAAKQQAPGSYLTKKLVAVVGRGTSNERRTVTDINLYYLANVGRWVSIP